MSEHRDPYDSGAAPAPAATCPTLDDPASENIRDRYGRIVRETWIRWAQTQPDIDQHPHWLAGWDDLPERDREVDRIIGFEVIAHWQRDCFLAAHPTPADPLTALERAFITATEEYADLEKKRWDFHSHAFRVVKSKWFAARDALLAARAATGAGT